MADYHLVLLGVDALYHRLDLDFKAMRRVCYYCHQSSTQLAPIETLMLPVMVPPISSTKVSFPMPTFALEDKGVRFYLLRLGAVLLHRQGPLCQIPGHGLQT